MTFYRNTRPDSRKTTKQSRVDISIGYGDIDEISIFANFENGFSESNFLGTAQLP